jgi:cytoskeleton protein RodZ
VPDIRRSLRPPERLQDMVEDKNSLSFGHYLKSIRLEKGIGLEEISNETKIRVDNLLLIEKEDFDRLPPEVYIKSFLRAYAKAVGADEEEAVRRYESSGFALKKTNGYDTKPENFSSKFWNSIVLYVGTLGIIVVAVLLVSIFREQTSLNNQVNQQIAGENIQGNFIKFPEDNDSMQCIDNEASENIAQKLLLSMIAVEETWIKVFIDDLREKEYSLKPGDRLDLKAASDFNLIIGNATGVNLIV